MIITIDGPTATGKSTIAKKLAHEIGYIYFDTGAMYRTITYGILKYHIDLNDPDALSKFLKDFHFEIKIKHGERLYYADGEDVTLNIRGREVTAYVSTVSAIPMVREQLVLMQQECATGVNSVFEGRDLGTVVFPNAELKIFLTGRPEVRAKRRFEELRMKFPKETEKLSVEEVLADIIARDQSDTSRENSPLKQAIDAYAIDTSDLTTEEIIVKILEYKDSLKTRPKLVVPK